MGFSENLGTLLWDPYNGVPTIQGTILGPPIFGNPHIGSYRGVLGSRTGDP